MNKLEIHIIKGLFIIIFLCIGQHKLFSKNNLNVTSNSKHFSYSQPSDAPVDGFDFLKEIEEDDNTLRERISNLDNQTYQSLLSSISFFIKSKNEVTIFFLHAAFRLKYNGIPIYNYINSYKI